MIDQSAGTGIIANQPQVAPVRTQRALEHDPERLGRLLAESGYFSDARQAAQAVVKILAGQELGFPAIASMTGISIVKGRVTLSANLIAAAIKRSGKYDYRVKELDNEHCVITFFQEGQEIGTSIFTTADAQAARLTGDNWKNYPRNMVFARAISNGAKWHCPDVFGGAVYTPDELGEEIDGETLPPLREQITIEEAEELESWIREIGLSVRQVVEMLQVAGAAVSGDADKTHLSAAIRALTPSQLQAVSRLSLRFAAGKG